MITVTLACALHPRYKGKGKPRSACIVCRELFGIMHSVRVFCWYDNSRAIVDGFPIGKTVDAFEAELSRRH